jgi:hypothetical protein
MSVGTFAVFVLPVMANSFGTYPCCSSLLSFLIPLHYLPFILIIGHDPLFAYPQSSEPTAVSNPHFYCAFSCDNELSATQCGGEVL